MENRISFTAGIVVGTECRAFKCQETGRLDVGVTVLVTLFHREADVRTPGNWAFERWALGFDF